MAMLPFASSTRSKRRAKTPVEVRIALSTQIWLLMERQRESPSWFFASLPSLRITASLILATAGVALAATLCASGNYRGAVLSAAVALGAGVLVAGTISAQTVLIAWFVTAPLASFYVRFPIDRSILTYNRLVFALVVIMLLVKSGYQALGTESASEASTLWNASPRQSTFSVSRFEIAWALLSVLALASAIARSNDVAYATRMAIDTFWLPLVAFHLARNYLDLRKGGRLLLLGGIALALFLFATGAFELAAGTDLFAYKGSELVREGERRVNGPFAADSSFAIICLIIFLFLLAAPKLFRVRFDRTGKLIYACAVAGAGIGALLPVFRAVGLALVLSWIVLQWSTEDQNRQPWFRAAARRVVPLGILLATLLVALVGWIATSAPSLGGSRLTDPRSAYGRLASWQGAAEIVFDNPVLGVGLTNYADYYDATHYYDEESPEEFLETKAGDSPHSNVLWIGAELGLTGLALYIAANAYLFLMGWRALKEATDSRRRLAASCLIAIIVAYWIPGLTLASGYYSDLNLYFLVLVGALNRFSNPQDALAVSERS
jgi:O-antigen ligase